MYSNSIGKSYRSFIRFIHVSIIRTRQVYNLFQDQGAMLRRRKREISQENEENSVFTDIFLTEIFLSRKNEEISVFSPS